MSEREQFEAWVKSKDSTAPLYRRDMKGSERIGQYCTHWIQDQWEAWQASRRAALEEAAHLCAARSEKAGTIGRALEAMDLALVIRALANGDNN